MAERIGQNLWTIDSAAFDTYYARWDGTSHRGHLVGGVHASDAASLAGAALRLVPPDELRAAVVLLSYFDIRPEIEETCGRAGALLRTCAVAENDSTSAIIETPDIHALLHVMTDLWDECHFMMAARGAFTAGLPDIDLAAVEKGRAQIVIEGADAAAVGTYRDQDVAFAVAPHAVETSLLAVLRRYEVHPRS